MAEQDPWAGFADASTAPSADPWAEFDDAPRSKSQRRRDRQSAKRTEKPGPVANRTEGDDIIVRPYDGDTLKLASGNSLRLWGADAPELQQQGWNALSRAVPVGLESRNALAGLTSPQSVIGAPEGQSYGRTVAPVTTNGSDVANDLLRSGNALAAPSFLASDPQRRYEYVQSERLARQNRLGMHGVYMPQTPAQYRDDPSYQPSREEIAQFWDTPTPDAGLTKEGEQGYLRVVNTGSTEDILAYADAHGFKVDPDEVRDFVSKRDSGAKVPQAVTYRNAPQPLTDLGDGKVGAAMRGVGNGVLPNMLEEVGAIPDTFGLTPGRENVWNSDRRLADIYANNLAQNEAITGNDRAAYPYTSGAAELAGSLVVPMARVRTAADLAKWGAAYGTLTGLGQEGTIPERLTSGVIGGGQGLVTTVLGGKALEAAAPYVGKAYDRLAGRRAPEAPVGAMGGLSDAPEPPPGFRLERSERQPIDVGEPAPAGGPVSVHPGGSPGENATSIEGVIGPLPHEGLAPANTGTDGRIYVGDAGTSHFQVAEKYPDVQFDGGTGFVTPDGQYLDRKQALDWVNGNGENIRPSDNMPGELDALDYRDQRRRPAAMDADPPPSLSQDVPPSAALDRPGRMDQPLTDAQIRARASDVQPGDVVPIPSNVVGSVEEAAAQDAGRYVEAKAPNERRELTSRTVTNFMGQPVPKAGPIDLVGWVRLQGGLSDAGDAVSKGGDLAAMGLTNASRKGMDFVGQEQRFGPLVNNADGMSLDDAAMRAWEAGYFPELTDRPDVNTFLDALRETHNGSRGRRFLADDLPEIDRYYGAQSNRYALEEQRFATGEPVYLDKSVPADDPAPFPPPQAYEEWPAGGPDFAGNIDLNKLDSPQDIKRALDFTNKRVGGFDAATRGRITNAETERLAGEMGMTPEALLSRRKGQAFNAEEAHAARQILAKSGNELVNMAKRVQGLEFPGDDVLADFRRAWMRHVAIQEQVSGMTAEAGRTLQQFRMAADSRAVKGSVLAAMVEGAGGRGRLQDAADILLDAVERDPGKFNVLTEQLAKPRFRDKAVELYYNMMLSNPSTHAVNVVSNTMTSLGQLPEHAVANVMGKGRELFNRGAVDRVTSTEIGRRTFGLMQGFKDGLRQFARTARTGETSDFVTKVESQAQEAIGGNVGKVIRTPSRLLAAEDELFKAVARRMELNGLAARKAHAEGLKGEAAAKRIAELVDVPTDDMMARAFDYGRYLTFQRPLGEIAGGVARMRSADGVFGPMMTMLVPFVRTPTNLLKFAVERSPGAPLLKEWRADFKAGGARRDLALARALVGTAFGATIYEAALNGTVSGSIPSDPVKAQFMRADGWQPYSFKVGDKWYSFSRLDPFATTIGVAADLATKREGMTKRQLDDYAMMLTASIIKNMGDKTWLSSASAFIQALTDPERYGPGYLRKMGAGLVTPAISSGAARAIDPTSRDVRSLGDAVQNRIPGLSDSLPAKRDIWGEPIVNEGGFGPDFLSPMWTSTEKNDPVNAEMLKIGARFDAPDRFIKKDGKRVDLTPEQYERYAEMAGRSKRAKIEALMKSPGWGDLDDAQKVARVSKAAKAANAEAKAELFGKGASTSTPEDAASPKDEWSAFSDGKPEASSGERDPWASFKDPPQRDVIGNLTSIPGLSMSNFTSGYRTPEYQADMRRRGYRPAQNSGHLDGSSLDIRVPAGRSMGWLMREVKRVEPTARLLPEGDHLHATFPGWYSAPVLGGATAAGLRNPMVRGAQ